MPRKRRATSKSDFIRSLPASLSANEVAEKAREAGITLTTRLVYKVRGRVSSKARKKATTSKSTATSVATPSPSAAPAAPGRRRAGPKSDFVRSQPANLSTAEVIARAKKAGISLTAALVYLVRGKGNSSAKRSATSKPRAVPASGQLRASDFIRAQPLSMSAKEVEQKGSAEGYRFGTSLVYRLRAAMGAKGKARAKAVAPSASLDHPAARSAHPPAGLSSLLDPIIADAVQKAVDGYRRMILGEDAQ